MIEKLIHGDCIEYMKSMDNESVDLIVTDPPYLIDYKTGRRKDKTHRFCSTIEGDDNPDLISEYIKEAYRIMKNDTAMYMFCNASKVDFFKQELEKYFTLRNIIVWVKNNHTAGDLRYSFGKKHEFIILVNKGNAPIRGKRIQDVWSYDKISSTEQIHQNQKPVELLQTCIEKHSDVGDLIFDGFAGSASTAIAARNLKRQYICIEKDKDYYLTAKKRLEGTNTSILEF